MPTWIRVRDETTGHEIDIHPASLRPGLVELTDYPPNTGPDARPRPAKHRVAKNGSTATPRTRRRDTPPDEQPTTPPPPPSAATPEGTQP